jgi:hypothetical protein
MFVLPLFLPWKEVGFDLDVFLFGEDSSARTATFLHFPPRPHTGTGATTGTEA